MEPSLVRRSDNAIAPKEAIISCQEIGLSFSHGSTRQQVLNNLSLNVRAGEIVSLLGPSGCGKSTLLRVVAGLTDPDDGQTVVDGNSVSSSMPRSARERVSFVFQEPALLPWRSVWQNVMLPLELCGTHRLPDNRSLVEHLLGLVGFQPSDWRKRPSQLSGGMKMRASIARAMTTRPKIMLLDEPFAALDDILRAKLNDLLLEISKEQSCTMLFVTHNIAEAIYLSHEIAIMCRGQIATKMPVPLPFPRDSKMRSSREFAAFYGVVSDALTGSNS